MTFEGIIIANTLKSILFHCWYWDEPDWMPKSQIDVLREEDTNEVRVLASDWICGQKGLKEFEYRPKKEEEQGNGTDY